MGRILPLAALLPVLALLAPGCGNTPATDPFSPINPEAALFWDRQTTESAELLRAIVDSFNAQHNGLPLQVEHVGGYGEIFRKVSASLQARALPAMAVSYPSMTAQYADAHAVLPLDELVSDPQRGFSPEDLADFFPAVLDTNRFEDHENALLSFPFTKSVLMLYHNNRVLKEGGLDSPPETWEEFLAHARAIKLRAGKKAHAISVDCSTVSAMIFSRGGDLLVNGVLQYDQPESIAVFEFYETLINEDLAYAIPPNTFDDEVALSNDQIAFTLRTSAGSAPLALAMGNDPARWGMTSIPQVNPAEPATILFGPNVTLFRVGAEQEAAAWAFVKHFTSGDVMIEWAARTGYLPVRKSAAQDPRMQEHWNSNPGSRQAFDALAFARAEPNLAGWQEIRDAVERALSSVLGKRATGREAALQLQTEASAILTRYRQ